MKFLTWFVVLTVFTGCISGCDAFNKDDAEEESYTVGIINPSPVLNSFFEDFFAAMQELGYVDGQNIEIITAGPAETTMEALVLPNQFEGVDLDVLVVFSIELALISRNTLPDMDIVFIGAADPLATGLLEDMVEPGRNITGVLAHDVSERRLQLLVEMAPDIEQIAVPYDARDTRVTASLESFREAADALGVTIIEMPMDTAADFPDVIANFPEDVETIFLLQDEQQVLLLDDWDVYAREHKLMLVIPGTASQENIVDNYFLMGYGVSLGDAAKQAARLSSQILRGVPPGDLPIENGEIRLFVNLSVADELGIEVPDHILAQADFVIPAGGDSQENADDNAE